MPKTTLAETPLTPNAEPRNPFAFERRGADRVPAAGPLQAVLANGRDMPWVMRLGLVNASAGGLCVTHTAPVAPGTRLSLRVDPVHGGWKTGAVVRCTPIPNVSALTIDKTKANAASSAAITPIGAGATDCYELGISYEVKQAAA